MIPRHAFNLTWLKRFQSPLLQRLISLVTIDRLVFLLVWVVIGMLLYRGWQHVSADHDYWGYHLMFSLRLSGLLPADMYDFSYGQLHRFEGFPLFGEWLQGMLIRWTGRLSVNNLVGGVTLVITALYLRLMFKVPWALSLWGWLAVPMVLIHTTSPYVDLLANGFALMGWLSTTALVLWVCEHGWTSRFSRAQWGHVAWALVGIWVAVHTKYMMLPSMTAAFLVLSVIWLGQMKAFTVPRSNQRPWVPWVLLVGMGLAWTWLASEVFYPIIKNYLLFHNPFYPIQVSFSRWVIWPGPEEGYLQAPRPWVLYPHSLKWVLSVLEWYPNPVVQGFEHFPVWNLDMAHRERLGGYWNLYVLGHLALLMGWFIRQGHRLVWGRVYVASLIGLSIIWSCQPQSHELRYGLIWVLLLVAVQMIVLVESRARQAKIQPLDASRSVLPLWQAEPSRAFTWWKRGVLLWVLVMFVLGNQLTDWKYVKSTPDPMPAILKLARFEGFKTHVLVPLQAQVPQEKPLLDICIRDIVELTRPWTLSYASYFHPEVARPYRLRIGYCGLSDRTVTMEEWMKWTP